ncbi:uncharacterized protein N7446_009230 [Penicillium canescens]|uniref:uncharacterized protein n=1 Tax=Penicillium canescens TaxID=5083 RepID=UPI0026E0112C|nr:uncharacterized protein N7446_009230 [Penicillium canescens]KAJ6053218.1 hypothetical protein N7446_009230 [Penicillium canescens]
MSDHNPPMENLLNLDEIEDVATRNVSKKAWAYYYSASDDKISKRLNSEAFRSIQLRPRTFIDCTECNLNTELLSNKVSIPIYISPAAMARLGHPAGEAGIAEACRSFGAMQIISNNASMSPEQIVANAAPDQVFGWQLYVQDDRSKSERMLARINKLSAIKFVALTLDSPVTGKREDDERSGNILNTMVESSSTEAVYQVVDGNDSSPPTKPTEDQTFTGLDPTLTWKETLSWLERHTALPVVLKGVQTHEDAYIASSYAPQIRKYCPEVFGKLDVWVDGGIKRGTDVVKAICLGARGVGIGRAALWGLGAGGVEGVKRTLQILTDETKTCMRLLGVQNVNVLGRQHINTRLVEQQIYNGPSGLEACKNKLRSKLSTSRL